MYQGNQGTRVRVGAIEMEYEEHGRGARPFLLVHGFTGSRDDWREVLPRLAARGRTLALDLRGHGGTTNTGDAAGYTLAQLSADVVGFLDALGIARCDLLGHSMGGFVAQRLVLDHPQRVSSLILMDTASEPIHRDTRKFFEVGAKIARENGMGALFQVARSAAQRDPHRAPSVVRCEERMGSDLFWSRNEKKMHQMDPVAFATLGPALVDAEPMTPRLGEIRCPTTVIVGREDKPFVKPAEVMAAAIPDAKLVVLENGAHCPQLEDQEAWMRAVLGHLDRARG